MFLSITFPRMVFLHPNNIHGLYVVCDLYDNKASKIGFKKKLINQFTDVAEIANIL